MPESESQPPFFELCEVRFAYRRNSLVLRGVNLSVAVGEMVALVGPNGAGKSTLLHLMNGLLSPSGGSVRLCGEPVGRYDPAERSRRTAYVPQASRVMFPYTVREIVGMGRRPHLGPWAPLSPADRDRIDWSLEVTGTRAFSERLFRELSGGEAQRVILARALAQETPALLLDEPTSALDIYYQAAIYGLLERLNREQGTTVLIVTHDVNLASEYCPRLVGIRDGKILTDGPPAEVVTPSLMHALYGVRAEVLRHGGVPMLRVRHELAADAPEMPAGRGVSP